MMIVPDSQAISLDAGGVRIAGDLVLPRAARGLVLFAHGSGSSRKSPRNQAVARGLNEARLGTLLLDLLTQREAEREEAGARLRFDVDAMAARVEGAIAWLGREGVTRDLPLGIFGASTGAAAALIAAARRKERVEAVVSRGGRPDLAGEMLPEVEAPVLLIVGGFDEEVLALNREALEKLRGKKELKVVPDATHLFEEPGALDQVAQYARDWFLQHLGHAR